MKKTLLAIIILAFPVFLFAQAPVDTANITDIDTTGQKDLLDIANRLFHFKKRRLENDRQIYFSVLPVSSAVPGGKALVTSTTAGFYLGPKRTTYLSSVTFAPYLNFAGRYGLPIHSSIWLKDNLYNVQGDIRFLVYPEYTWGLGGGQNEKDRILVDYNYIRFYQTLLKRITPAFYAGIGYNLDYYINIHANQGTTTTIQNFTGYPYGDTEHSNSISSGLNLDLLYDTRQNSLNPIPGVFGNLIYRHDTRVLGSDNDAQSIYIDFRKYLSLHGDAPGKNQLAFWFYYWSTISSGTPFLQLPAIGMDPYQRSGRGIEQNRYRGNELLYFETEYRRDITRDGLFGFVLFANFDSATQNNTREFKYVNPAGGGGLRVKFNKRSNTNLGLDFGASKGYSTLIFSLGEAF